MTVSLQPLLAKAQAPFVAIGDIATCYSGATPESTSAEFWEGGTIPWMSSGEVNRKIIDHTEKLITPSAFESCSTKMVPPNSVVMALAGQGKTRGLVARTRIELCTNQSLCAIVPSERLDADYLFHYLSGQYQTLRALSSGDGGRGGLNQQMIKSFLVPLPSIELQKSIAAKLDEFQALEAELEAELEARRKQYEHYRNQLLTFAPDQGGVRWLTLANVGSFIRGNGIQKNVLASSGKPVIHYGQVFTHYGAWATQTKSKIDEGLWASARKAFQGDLVLATTSENVEDVCKAVAWLGDEAAAVSSDAMIFKHDLDPLYATYWFQSTHFSAFKQSLVTGTKVKRISAEALGRLPIAVPSLDEQRVIGRQLQTFESLLVDHSIGLPAEIAARRKQYEFYRNQLLSFEEIPA